MKVLREDLIMNKKINDKENLLINIPKNKGEEKNSL